MLKNDQNGPKCSEFHHFLGICDLKVATIQWGESVWKIWTNMFIEDMHWTPYTIVSSNNYKWCSRTLHLGSWNWLLSQINGINKIGRLHSIQLDRSRVASVLYTVGWERQKWQIRLFDRLKWDKKLTVRPNQPVRFCWSRPNFSLSRIQSNRKFFRCIVLLLIMYWDLYSKCRV